MGWNVSRAWGKRIPPLKPWFRKGKIQTRRGSEWGLDERGSKGHEGVGSWRFPGRVSAQNAPREESTGELLSHGIAGQ